MRKLIKYILKLFGYRLEKIQEVKIGHIGYAIEKNSIKNDNDAYFNDHIKNTRNNPVILKIYPEILEKVDIGINSVAEFGCGVSPLLKVIKQTNSDIDFTGYEHSKNAVSFLRKKYPENNFYIHDIYKPVKEKYDIVFCLEVLEHLQNPELVLKNLINSANKKVVITVPNGRLDDIPFHIHFWSPESLKLFIEKNCNKKFKQYLIKNGKSNLCIIDI